MTVTNNYVPPKNQVSNVHEWVFQAGLDGINLARIIDGSTGVETSGSAIIEDSRRVASALISRELGTEAVVAVALPNLTVVAEIALGVLSSGCALAMLNPKLAPEVLARKLDEVDARILITTSETQPSQIPGTQYETILIDSWDQANSYNKFKTVQSPDALPVVSPDSVALIFQSSGTTSPSKPIELTHKNVVVGLEAVAERMKLNSSDSSMAVAPMFHVLGFYMMLLTPLRYGMQVVTLAEIDMETAIDLIDEYKITYMAGGPPMMKPIANAGAAGRLTSLRRIHFGGAPIDSQTEYAIKSTFPHAVTGQGYALTEFMLISFVAQDDGHPIGTVGRIVNGIEMKIVNPEDGQEFVNGEIGEIIVKGPQMMKGYRGLPEATAAAIDSDGWFHTGDLGNVDKEGFLFITGRLKEMIVSNGQRIAPKVFEELIRPLDAVKEVVVAGTREYPQSSTPIAFVVGSGVTTRQITSALESRPELPECEVVFVDAIPRSPAGKILRIDLLKSGKGIFDH